MKLNFIEKVPDLSPEERERRIIQLAYALTESTYNKLKEKYPKITHEDVVEILLKNGLG
jgi:hypothetical protein